jgi:hypothetical protein
MRDVPTQADRQAGQIAACLPDNSTNNNSKHVEIARKGICVSESFGIRTDNQNTSLPSWIYP